jgi:hypothetical protein
VSYFSASFSAQEITILSSRKETSCRVWRGNRKDGNWHRRLTKNLATPDPWMLRFVPRRSWIDRRKLERWNDEVHQKRKMGRERDVAVCSKRRSVKSHKPRKESAQISLWVQGKRWSPDQSTNRW